VLKLYFSANGRISRQQFWHGVFGIVVILVLVMLILMRLVPVLAAFAFVYWPVALIILSIKRLHDRGKSGWWVVVFIILPTALDTLGDTLTEGEPVWWLSFVAMCAFGLWGLIEIGFLRGTEGDNEYGPDPLAR
jgi:uncharacterized membrane protein YhaH (DUF805 family)